MSMKKKLFMKTWKLGKLNKDKLLKTKSVDLDKNKKRLVIFIKEERILPSDCSILRMLKLKSIGDAS